MNGYEKELGKKTTETGNLMPRMISRIVKAEMDYLANFKNRKIWIMKKENDLLRK